MSGTVKLFSKSYFVVVQLNKKQIQALYLTMAITDESLIELPVSSRKIPAGTIKHEYAWFWFISMSMLGSGS